MTRPTSFLAGLAAAAALLAGGCGGDSEPETYRLPSTRACLQEAGFAVTTRELDFVASTAARGAVRAELPDNEVTISLGDSEEEATRTARAYRSFAGSKIPIEHVLFQHQNAVLVWAVPPSESDLAQVVACLRE